MNRDTAEIDKFAALAHQWWDENGELRTLHQLNPLRLAWIESQAGTLADKTVLDIGCGGGILAESMAKKGATSVLGIDLADKSIKVAKLHALEAGIQNLRYQSIAAEDLAVQQAASFDVVTCMEMLEHVPDPASIVQAAAQALKPGGVAVFSTINRNAKAWGLAIVAAEYVLGLVPRGTHHYDKLVCPSELAAWARAAGLTLTASSGVEYHPLTRRVSLSANTDVNYILAFEKQL
jgi:2-polyprenyl-6-hydroxyphenyl methylase/3-demethylubiquinone-9 3-methyltransferase